LIAHAGGFLEEVIDMRIRDYLDGGNRAWVQLGVGDAARLIEIRPRVRQHIEEYITAANIRDDDSFSSLFRVTRGSWKRGLYNERFPARLAARRISDQIAKASEMLSPNQVAQLLKSIQGRGFVNRRDRTILGLMLYGSVSPETIARLRMHDYCLGGNRPRLRLGSGVFLDIPQALAELLDNYLAAIHWKVDGRSPIFRGRGTRSITPMEIRRIIENRRVGRKPQLASENLTRAGRKRARPSRAHSI
jgi:hypothetical protein